MTCSSPFARRALAGIPFDVLKGAVGFALETLPGDGALFGQLRDSTVATEEDGGGTGKAAESGYDPHGVDFCARRLVVLPSLQMLTRHLSS